MDKTFYSAIILSIILVFSCKKDKHISYPVEPHLEFKNIIINSGTDILGYKGDSISLILDYTDGDANIGKSITCDACYNCFTTFYKKEKGIFNLINNDLFQNPINLVIRENLMRNQIQGTGPIKVIPRTLYEGELQIKLYLAPYSNPYSLGDTLKITVEIIDNDGNKSNIAEMDKAYSY